MAETSRQVFRCSFLHRNFEKAVMVAENGIAASSFYCLLMSCLLLLFYQAVFWRAGSSIEDGGAQELYKDKCEHKRIYIYDLPKRFNEDLVQRCDSGIVKWLNFCRHISNDGFGEPLPDELLARGWYRTDSYMLEVIFHSRIRRYACLTNNSAEADAFFVPYYGGLDALHYLYNPGADKNSHGAELASWIKTNAETEWSRNGGRDHFLVMGRTSWDFEVPSEKLTEWGTPILSSPTFSNMSILFFEKNPWKLNQHAVPYPTSFHPASLEELRYWISKVEGSERRYLFSFAGGMRPSQSQRIRSLLLEQCLASKNCSFVNCGELSCGHNPAPIVASFLSSRFCLQPRGDSSTRRSAFDSIISGCIPVFFHQDSAYSQYTWHLPADPEAFSVFISEEQVRNGARIEQILAGYSQEQVLRMRRSLVEMIPKVIYTQHGIPEVPDAFDVSIGKILEQLV